MVCTFFGHHDCPNSIKTKLFVTIKTQIEQGTLQFYVGNHGNFDAMALSCLRELKKKYPNMRYAVVLAYIPTIPGVYQPDETVYPEGIESVPLRFAIDFRNRWMLAQADVVVAYFSHAFGNAAKYVEKAQKNHATVINLSKK